MKLLNWLNLPLLAGLIVLYILHFSVNKTSKPIADTKSVEIKKQIGHQQQTIAFVNSDSIWANYQLVLDKQKEMMRREEATKSRYQSEYEKRMKAMQTRYNKYIEEAKSGLLTLEQQQRIENELAMEQEELQYLEPRMSNELLKEHQQVNDMLTEKVLSFIDSYNQIHGQYTFVLNKSLQTPGVLYADSTYDLTNEILDGLNKAYTQEQKQKK